MSRIPVSCDKVIYKLGKDVWENLELRDLTLKNKLFVDGWYLEKWMKGMDLESDSICVGFYDGIPMAVTTRSYMTGHIMFFVSPDFRNQGIGKELAKIICAIPGKRFGVLGIPASKYFFQSIGVELHDDL